MTRSFDLGFISTHCFKFRMIPPSPGYFEIDFFAFTIKKSLIVNFTIKEFTNKRNVDFTTHKGAFHDNYIAYIQSIAMLDTKVLSKGPGRYFERPQLHIINIESLFVKIFSNF